MIKHKSNCRKNNKQNRERENDSTNGEKIVQQVHSRNMQEYEHNQHEKLRKYNIQVARNNTW